MMAEQSDNCQEISEEEQLKEQLESICLDYQLLINKSREMAPKGTQSKKSDPNTENSIDDEDLEGEWVILNYFFFPFEFMEIFPLCSYQVCLLNNFVCVYFVQKLRMYQIIWIH